MDRYTHGHHASVLRTHASRTAADCAAYLLPWLHEGDRVLDVGCGPGTITLDLADVVGSAGQVVGIDAAPAALEAARAEAARRDDARTRFEVADVYALPYADGAFDVVHAHQVLQHLTDPVAALREMARVVRPGGLIAARDADYSAMSWYPVSDGLTSWLSTYQQLARHNGAEPDAGRHLLAWAHAAGLPEVTVSAATTSYAGADPCTWWAQVWADRVRHSEFADQARESGRSDAELDDLAAAWLAWGRHPDALFAILHVQILARR